VLVGLKLGNLAASVDDTHVHSGTLEEEGGLVGDQVSGKVLRCVDQAGDDRAAEIGALPQVQERSGAANVGFNLDRALDHRERFVGALLGVVAEAFDRSQGFFFAAAADEPPWRFGGEEEEDEEGELWRSVWGGDGLGCWMATLTGKIHWSAAGILQLHWSSRWL
jgi:hypothetical protein